MYFVHPSVESEITADSRYRGLYAGYEVPSVENGMNWAWVGFVKWLVHHLKLMQPSTYIILVVCGETHRERLLMQQIFHSLSRELKSDANKDTQFVPASCNIVCDVKTHTSRYCLFNDNMTDASFSPVYHRMKMAVILFFVYLSLISKRCRLLLRKDIYT